MKKNAPFQFIYLLCFRCNNWRLCLYKTSLSDVANLAHINVSQWVSFLINFINRNAHSFITIMTFKVRWPQKEGIKFMVMFSVWLQLLHVSDSIKGEESFYAQALHDSINVWMFFLLCKHHLHLGHASDSFDEETQTWWCWGKQNATFPLFLICFRFISIFICRPLSHLEWRWCLPFFDTTFQLNLKTLKKL